LQRYKPYSVLLCLLLAVACSKEAIEFFVGFKTPYYFPAATYDFSKNHVSKSGFELGKMIFYDSTLSIDNSTSCASCHMQSSAFTHPDHSLSHGLHGSLTRRNAPPIMNLAWSNSFMWDGSVDKLDQQPVKPFTNQLEMGETMPNILKKVNSSGMYRGMFKDAFGTAVATEDQLLKALSQFMVMAVSNESKYDSVKRNQASFSDIEQAGYAIFVQKCNGCHSEPLFTDNSFRNTLLPPNELMDSGRYVVTRNISDLYRFKVPSLRNLGYTKPYMHDGRFSNIDKVLDHYNAKLFSISADERTKLKAFLLTLDDKVFVSNPLFAKGTMNH
jgi:cytochrome c peroxidase